MSWRSCPWHWRPERGLIAIAFENERYVYVPYLKVDQENVDTFIERSEVRPE